MKMMTSRKLKTFFMVTLFFVITLICYWSRSDSLWNVNRKEDNEVENVHYVINNNMRLPLIQSPAGNGRDEFMSRVVYNRVGKCGSRTMQNIIRILSQQNSYHFYLSTVSNETRPKILSIIKEVKLIDSIASPMLYSRHIHFMNFPKYGVRKPLYINLIRDPIERFSSQYHFKRYGDMIVSKGRQTTFRLGEKELDINDCVMRNYSECMPPRLWYIIPYFCGQAAFCRIPSPEALRRAKMNVLDNYIAVGVLEDFEGSLKVFEKLLPMHFKGATEAYQQLLQDASQKNTTTIGKKELNPAAYSMLRKRMEYDYEFYDFVFSLFKGLKKKLNLDV